MKNKIPCLLLLLLTSFQTFSQSISGQWVTIDDKTKKPRAIVELIEEKGLLNAKIIRVFKQSGDKGICAHCPGKFKNQSIQGLEFVWGLKRQSNYEWRDGHILDPKSGRIYRCKITQAGNDLNVRGYWGVSLLGRTQTWHRIDNLTSRA